MRFLRNLLVLTFVVGAFYAALSAGIASAAPATSAAPAAATHSQLGYCGPPFTSKASMIAWLEANPQWAARAEAYVKRYAYYHIRSDQTIIAWLQMPNVKFRRAPNGYLLTPGAFGQPANTGCSADGSPQGTSVHLDASNVPGLFWCNDPTGPGYDCVMLAKYYCRNWVHGPMAFPKPYTPAKKPSSPKYGPITISKSCEDVTMHQLFGGCPTNTFRFRVSTPGNKQTVTFNPAPGSVSVPAGNCRVGSVVTTTELATSGWKVVSSNGNPKQTLTCTSKGALFSYKNMESTVAVPTAPVTVSKSCEDVNENQLVGGCPTNTFTFVVTPQSASATTITYNPQPGTTDVPAGKCVVGMTVTAVEQPIAGWKAAPGTSSSQTLPCTSKGARFVFKNMELGSSTPTCPAGQTGTYPNCTTPAPSHSIVISSSTTLNDIPAAVPGTSPTAPNQYFSLTSTDAATIKVDPGIVQVAQCGQAFQSGTLQFTAAANGSFCLTFLGPSDPSATTTHIVITAAITDSSGKVLASDKFTEDATITHTAGNRP